MHYYKYYSTNKLSFKTLRNNRIFFANPSLLNDSFDTSSKIVEAYPNFCKSIGWTSIGKMNLNQHGIFSMSKGNRPDNRHLWSLYAGNFTGFAIEFRNEILKSFTGQNNLCISSVQYVKRPLDLDNHRSTYSIPEREEGHSYNISDCWRFGDTYIQLSDGSLCLIDKLKAQERLFEYLHLQKDSAIWQMEKEARIIICNSVPSQAKVLRNGYYMTLPQGCIAKIYIGKYMKGVFKKRLKKIAKRLLAETYEVEPKIIQGNWDVEITKV